MKTKNIIIIALASMAVLYAISLVTQNSNSTINNPFLVTDTASVERIFLVDKQNNSVDLSRENGVWTLNKTDKPIEENINILLKTLLKIEIMNPVSKSSYNTNIKRLATKSTKVEVYQRKYRINIFGLQLFPHSAITRTFYVGGPTPNYRGTVMMSAEDEELYITNIPGFKGYLTERFTSSRADWMSHEIFAYNIMDIKSVKISFPRDINESYEIHNEGSRTFKLVKLQDQSAVNSFDTIRLLEELSAFSKINYEALLDGSSQQKVDSLLGILPARIVEVETKLGNTRKLSMYYRPNYDERRNMNGDLFPHDMDRMYAFIDDSKELISVQFFVIDNISRPLSFFRKLSIDTSVIEELDTKK